MSVPSVSAASLGALVPALLWSLLLPMHAERLPPTSKRFQSVRERVAPRLKADLQAQGLALGAPVFLRVFKEEAELEVWIHHDSGRFKKFRTYPIAAFSGALGPKLQEGDRQAPEGFYHVSPGRMNPNSRFHLSFNLGYPNAFDRAHGRTGSFLMVHGSQVSIGCYAMTDPLIEEIYTLADAALRRGQPFFRVHCFPFRMADERMARLTAKEAPWRPFWENLREGYAHFERHHLPPDVTVSGKRYQFNATE
jgi:murein L,D-transpeptidase YafK